jgi:hypothetical protein
MMWNVYAKLPAYPFNHVRWDTSLAGRIAHCCEEFLMGFQPVGEGF